MEEPNKLENNRIIRDEKGLFVKGTPPPNPAGRPKGKTLKEWVRERLITMSEEEREEFLATIPKEIQWRMAEGNPHQTQDVEQKGKVIIEISKESAEKNNVAPSETEGSL